MNNHRLYSFEQHFLDQTLIIGYYVSLGRGGGSGLKRREGGGDWGGGGRLKIELTQRGLADYRELANVSEFQFWCQFCSNQQVCTGWPLQHYTSTTSACLSSY